MSAQQRSRVDARDLEHGPFELGAASGCSSYARNGAGQASIFGIEKRAIVPKPSAGLHACATPASHATERKMNASSIVKPCSSTSSFAASCETSWSASA